MALLGALLVGLVGVAPPAAAHGGEIESTDHRTRITGVEPTVPGLEIRLIEAGSRVELVNRGSAPAVVLGYEDEPYLRVTRDGVFRNRNSPATYLNARRTGGDEVPPEASADADPAWERIGDGPTARWHDHRMHWMAPKPAGVRADPGREQHLADWILPVMVGGRRVEVRGDISYVPGPPVWPWLAGAATLAVLTVVAARRRSTRVALLVGIPVLLLADVTRVLALTFALEGGVGDRLGQFADVGLLGLLGWGLGLAAVVRLARGHDDGVPLAGLGAVVIAVTGGALEWGDIGRSQVAVAGPDDLARLCVSLATGLGGGVAAAVLLDVLRPGAPPGSSVAG